MLAVTAATDSIKKTDMYHLVTLNRELRVIKKKKKLSLKIKQESLVRVVARAFNKYNRNTEPLMVLDQAE